ncbi:MAG: glycosyl transferase [Lachnospiraceae bacterium]|nr:glycosyl transferase [Lachnospiraceae bacterium]
MKKIACFCIPAHGHTNPMLPVTAELVRRGDEVRFYSFNEFEEKIRKTGATFISCDSFLPELNAEEEAALKSISTTDMAIQDIRISLAMNDFLAKEFTEFGPDVVYTDSVCFWGKLNSMKFKVPMVVSTSTFAFNRLSSQYMKSSPAEIMGLITGLPRLSKELKTLEPYGYNIKNPLTLIQSDNDTDSVVYTSKRFQPYAKSFSGHYLFAGPSVFSEALPDKKKERPLIYISMGTVINDRPDFYANCFEALKDMDADVILSCGNSVKQEELGNIPENFRVYPYVDQLDILSGADVFITHCGMNSVSESLYMATAMVLYPQTSEQQAVARCAVEAGAGLILKDDSPAGIRDAVCHILKDASYAKAAKECSDDFRSCPGVSGAADFIENAPHKTDSPDPLKIMAKESGKYQLIYWLIVLIIAVLVGVFIAFRYLWIPGLAGGLLNGMFGKLFDSLSYARLKDA